MTVPVKTHISALSKNVWSDRTLPFHHPLDGFHAKTTTTTTSSSSSSWISSKARIVVPRLDGFLNDMFDDEEVGTTEDLLSTADRLWNKIDGDDPNTLSPPLASKDSNFLRLHLETQHHRKNPPTMLGSSSSDPQNLKGYCKKTGTTIAGCVISNKEEGPFVILAADTRATDRTLVADKTCSKIHPLASNCWCCGAGASGDLDKVTRNVLYNMALIELQSLSVGNGNLIDEDDNESSNANIDGVPSTKEASPIFPNSQLLRQQGYSHSEEDDDDSGEPLLYMLPVSIPILCKMFQDQLFRAQGNLGANLILGGVWQGEAYLRAIHPHGSMDVGLPFAALGSGGLAAMAVLEEGYRPDLTLEKGIELVQRSILSGIRNDLGSGSQVDLCVIFPDGSSRHNRRVVPEEFLEDVDVVWEKRDEDGETVGKDVDPPRTRSSSSFGVNGFGNQPFSIESTRQRILSIEANEARHKTIWDNALDH
ncbi:proteasome subunit beta [Nitzschia inconspicua]|uniref:Proteasome subunit beta n=1 Tax=Nitzschia inconspicua TaxID=303405 RepID=A0A9K3PWL1_9STRA|nr:proteasome subunit beta [Nitzschia inconspicua]KAG7362260.1 proteasome subunit beta [Nitzschia inconspicua]